VRRRSLVVVAALVATLTIFPAAPAAAHPLGNFSVNLFSEIEVSRDRITVTHVVDMAEIPTFQEYRAIDSDRDRYADRGELRAYAARVSMDLSERLTLFVDEEESRLIVTDATAEVLPGQGGLDVLRIESTFVSELPSPRASIEYADDNYPDRMGWREIVARGVDGQGIADSTVSSESVTKGLRDYPRAGLSSPVDVTRASLVVTPGARSVTEVAPETPAEGPLDLFASAFSALIEHDLSVGFFGFALVVAMAAGALHALGPGHGKSVMAAYLVGANGRARHAVAVGVAISLMHTASVIVLGLVTLWASSTFPPERVYPYLSLTSGGVVMFMGAWLLWFRLRPRVRADRLDDERAHDHHPHAHEHAHGGAVHHHGPRPDAGYSPLSWKGLGVLALSGGLLPSPTALVVLLGAIALERVAFGLTLVGAFSVGLAAALALLGVLVLRARGFAERRLGSRPAALLPILSAGAVCLLGVFLTTRAVAGL
jgi:nickel/cobalt transporter (NicO) family protein